MKKKDTECEVPRKLQQAVLKAEEADVPMEKVREISENCVIKANNLGGATTEKLDHHQACTIKGIKDEIKKQKERKIL
ncbi:MAG: hypothetical protein HWN65_05565 [Candidatus Helarchaeota archaeon]|nr:hypothetical protein [Candidatus Helarchaeota archaeon]